MSVPEKRRATYADLESIPDSKIAEILDGELFVSPRPASPHAVVLAELQLEIGPPFGRGDGGPGGWVILQEPELHLSGDALIPDLAAWRRTRMPVIPEVAAFELAPDWICEVLSPSTETIDRARKLRIYAREGIEHAWLINPISKTLEVMRRAGQFWTLLAVHEGDARVRAEPFDAIELAMSRLWSR